MRIRRKVPFDSEMRRRTLQSVLVVVVVFLSVSRADEGPRASSSYSGAAAERRLFPIFAVPKVRPGIGTKGQGVAPRPPQGSYPAAKPPHRPPSQAYGPPTNSKPTGYPSSNHHQIQDVYITYPPAPSSSYPSLGNYGPTTPTYESPSQSYLPPSSSSTKPLYGGTVSYPSKPSYEPQPAPVNPPPNTPPPTNYFPSGQPGYPAASPTGSYVPAPSYPAPSGSYAPSPSYPAAPSGSSYAPSSSSGYPSSSGSYGSSQTYPASSGSYKPAPSYPASSGSSYKPASTGHAPIFVFIPKPGYFNGGGQVQKPVNKPTSYPPGKPSYQPPNQQYYPAPVKPYKPSGGYPAPKPQGYPAPKPPSTSYGVPKGKPLSGGYGAGGGSYRTDNFNSEAPAPHVVQPLHKPSVNPSLSASSSWPPPLVAAPPPTFPTTFHRGSPFRPDQNHDPRDNNQISESANSILVGFNRSVWTVEAADSNIHSFISSPTKVNSDLPFFRDELTARRPPPTLRPNFQNDCGGSWIILDEPANNNVDPTQVKVEPIPSGSAPGRFKNAPNSRPSSSFITLPPGFNDLPEIPITEKPEFLIFSATSPSNIAPTTTSPWRSPERLKPDGQISSFSASRPILDESAEPNVIVSNGFVIRNSATRPVQTLASTENSIVLSLNQAADGVDSPSPFLNDIVAKSVNRGNSIKNLSLTSSQHLNEEPSDSIVRKLRDANLRAISALLDQAEVATLIQDKEYTLLAPSNAAFNQMTPPQRQRWINRPDALREMLLHHVIPGQRGLSSFENEATPATLAGSRRLRINIYNMTDKNVTTVNGARVLTPDLRIGNLLVHVVDRVLFPTGQQNILEILNDGGRLQSLHASLLGPALSAVLSSDSSPMTIFVPTTEAFLGVSQEEQQLFLHNETAFHNLLWYHIVPGTYYSEGLEDGQWLSTLRGVGRLRVNATRQNRRSKLEKINGLANVVESDISATNGVVHFIDRVLTKILFNE